MGICSATNARQDVTCIQFCESEFWHQRVRAGLVTGWVQSWDEACSPCCKCYDWETNRNGRGGWHLGKKAAINASNPFKSFTYLACKLMHQWISIGRQTLLGMVALCFKTWKSWMFSKYWTDNRSCCSSNPQRRWLAYLPIPGGGGNPQSCTKTEFCAQNLKFIPGAPPFSSPNPDFSAGLNPQHFFVGNTPKYQPSWVMFILAKQPCQSNPVAQNSCAKMIKHGPCPCWVKKTHIKIIQNHIKSSQFTRIHQTSHFGSKSGDHPWISWGSSLIWFIPMTPQDHPNHHF